MRTRKHDIDHWDAEDVDAWNNGGAKIARRNLIWSIFAEHVGFSVWSIWSVMVLFMPQDIYHIDAAGKFFLVAMPTLVGAVLRLPYTFAIAKFGGRNWTVFSATVLLVPTLLTLYFMAHPGTSYTTFMIVAAIAGVGGGNFASSMTNINAFYPQRLKGWALGLNAGGGNIGVAMIQIVGLLVIAAVGNRSPHWVCAVYLVLLSDRRRRCRALHGQPDQSADQWPVDGRGDGIPRLVADRPALHRHVRVVHRFLVRLRAGAADQLPRWSEPGRSVTTSAMTAQASLHAAQIAFLGPLLGSIARPPGGWLSDRIGGSRVTLYTFAAMIGAAGWLVVAGQIDDATRGAASGGTMVAYVIGFVALFVLSGIGNGSVYKMIPSIFDAKAQSMEGLSQTEKADWSRRMSGALIGIAGAIGALGGVGINVILRASYLSTAKSATMAFWVFLAFYVLCAAITWFAYVRRPVRAPAIIPMREAVAQA